MEIAKIKTSKELLEQYNTRQWKKSVTAVQIDRFTQSNDLQAALSAFPCIDMIAINNRDGSLSGFTLYLILNIFDDSTLNDRIKKIAIFACDDSSVTVICNAFMVLDFSFTNVQYFYIRLGEEPTNLWSLFRYSQRRGVPCIVAIAPNLCILELNDVVVGEKSTWLEYAVGYLPLKALHFSNLRHESDIKDGTQLLGSDREYSLYTLKRSRHLLGDDGFFLAYIDRGSILHAIVLAPPAKLYDGKFPFMYDPEVYKRTAREAILHMNCRINYYYVGPQRKNTSRFYVPPQGFDALLFSQYLEAVSFMHKSRFSGHRQFVWAFNVEDRVVLRKHFLPNAKFFSLPGGYTTTQTMTPYQKWTYNLDRHECWPDAIPRELKKDYIATLQVVKEIRAEFKDALAGHIKNMPITKIRQLQRLSGIALLRKGHMVQTMELDAGDIDNRYSKAFFESNERETMHGPYNYSSDDEHLVDSRTWYEVFPDGQLKRGVIHAATLEKTKFAACGKDRLIHAVLDTVLPRSRRRTNKHRRLA